MDALRKNNVEKDTRLNDVIATIIITAIMLFIAVFCAFAGYLAGLVAVGFAVHIQPVMSFSSAWSSIGFAVAVVVGIICFLFLGGWAFMVSVSKMAYTVSRD